VKVFVRRSLYVRSLTGVLQFGAGKRDSLLLSHLPYPWEVLEGVLRKIPFEKRKILRKDWGTT
jgi:hypothetical protein